MYTVFFRTVIVFMVVLTVMRLMGKRQIGEMQPFELVITLIGAEIACIPMSDTSIPLSHGLIPILTLVVLHYLISFIGRKSLFFRRLISGNPIIVIDPSGINYENLRKMNMNVNDLLEALRSGDHFRLEDIKYAIFETNGKMCVINYEDAEAPTRADLGIKSEPAALPVALVVDGKILNENLRLCGMDEAGLIKTLHKNGEDALKKLTLVTVDNNGGLYIQPKNGKFKTGSCNISGGKNW